MTPRALAQMIESYLEADDAGGTSTAAATPIVGDNGTRQKVAELTQTTDQLQKDNDKLQKDLASLKSNLQMSAMLPLLMNQSQVISDVRDQAGDSVQVWDPATASWVSLAGGKITLQPADKLITLLPLLLYGLGDGGGGGSSDTMMIALALLLK